MSDTPKGPTGANLQSATYLQACVIKKNQLASIERNKAMRHHADPKPACTTAILHLGRLRPCECLKVVKYEEQQCAGPGGARCGYLVSRT